MTLEQRLLPYMRKKLTKHRFDHCLGVAQTAKELAERYQSDAERAYLAGLAHDISKWMSNEQMLAYAMDHGYGIDDLERRDPHLMHAKISASILKEEFFVTDEKILSAVEKHISGSEDMSKLDAIVCLSDWIEPGRTFSDIPALRELAKTSLEDALATALATTMQLVLQNKGVVHPQSLYTYNALRLLLERKETLT